MKIIENNGPPVFYGDAGVHSPNASPPCFPICGGGGQFPCVCFDDNIVKEKLSEPSPAAHLLLPGNPFPAACSSADRQHLRPAPERVQHGSGKVHPGLLFSPADYTEYSCNFCKDSTGPMNGSQWFPAVPIAG